MFYEDVAEQPVFFDRSPLIIGRVGRRSDKSSKRLGEIFSFQKSVCVGCGRGLGRGGAGGMSSVVVRGGVEFRRFTARQTRLGKGWCLANSSPL